MYEGHSRKGLKYGGYDYYYQGDFRPDHRVKEPGPHRDDRENHVLLITVINPAYPITCEIINQICLPSGRVLRVVIFKKNGVQAMVELDSIESARRVKQELHGRDIYTDCCTLRVEYAKPTRLNVYKNDSESFDFTKPSLGKNKKSFPPNDGSGPRSWGPSQDYIPPSLGDSSVIRPLASVSAQGPTGLAIPHQGLGAPSSQPGTFVPMTSSSSTSPSLGASTLPAE